MKQSPSEVQDSDLIDRCSYCGDLKWAIEKYGFALHKEQCPIRTNKFHQGNRPVEVESPSEEGKEPLWKTIQEQAIDVCHVEERYKIYENVEGHGAIHAYMDGVEYGLKLQELEKSENQDELWSEVTYIYNDDTFIQDAEDKCRSKFLISRRG